MTHIKVTRWPTVLSNDDGIRPAGNPDQCFYCHAKVGDFHGHDCVTVGKLVSYELVLHDTVIGTFERMDPFFWTLDDCEFHKNESSWCQGNMIGDPGLSVHPEIFEWMDSLEDLCEADIYVRPVEVKDCGPFITLPAENQLPSSPNAG